MADPEHLRIAKKGPQAWNIWRQQAGRILVDLSGANLRVANLREAVPVIRTGG